MKLRAYAGITILLAETDGFMWRSAFLQSKAVGLCSLKLRADAGFTILRKEIVGFTWRSLGGYAESGNFTECSWGFMLKMVLSQSVLEGWT